MVTMDCQQLVSGLLSDTPDVIYPSSSDDRSNLSLEAFNYFNFDLDLLGDEEITDHDFFCKATHKELQPNIIGDVFGSDSGIVEQNIGLLNLNNFEKSETQMEIDWPAKLTPNVPVEPTENDNSNDICYNGAKQGYETGPIITDQLMNYSTKALVENQLSATDNLETRISVQTDKNVVSIQPQTSLNRQLTCNTESSELGNSNSSTPYPSQQSVYTVVAIIPPDNSIFRTSKDSEKNIELRFPCFTLLGEENCTSRMTSEHPPMASAGYALEKQIKPTFDLFQRYDLVKAISNDHNNAAPSGTSLPSESIRKGPKTTNTFRCEICRKTCVSKTGFVQHWHSAHGNFKPYKCEQCGKRFENQVAWQQHQLNHSEANKKYSCDLCERKYCQRTDLRKHRYSHTGFRFKCSIGGCGKAFQRADHLRKHVKSHQKRLQERLQKNR